MIEVFGLYQRLLAEYGPQGWWPLVNHSGQPGYSETGYHTDGVTLPNAENDRCEILVGAILTQNTSWRNVAGVLQSLKQKGLLNPMALVAIPQNDLAQAIHSAGYHNQKAKKLQGAIAAAIQNNWLPDAGTIPTRDELLALWGIGPETADCLLLYIWGRASFVVDAYTRRLLSRIKVNLEFDPLKLDYQTIRLWFQTELAKHGLGPENPASVQVYGEYHALIVRHAVSRCLIKPDCRDCPFLADCRV